MVDNIAKGVWGKKEGTKYSNPRDFMPDWDRSKQIQKESEEEATQTVDEMKSIMMGLVHRTQRPKKKEQK
jgi:hypothetical protein